MPFTLTHLLAGVPIAAATARRRLLSVSALAIGCVVPDLPLFAKVGTDYVTTHSFTGIWTACVPIGFCVYVFFQMALKRALFELGPDWMRERLMAYATKVRWWRLSEMARVVMGLAIGAATHIVWDAFTHEGRWGVAWFPMLDEVLFSAGGVGVRGYKLLQHGSTAVGLPLLIWMGVRWVRGREAIEAPPGVLRESVRYTLIVAMFVLPVIVAGVVGGAEYAKDRGSLGRVVFDGIILTGQMVMALVSAYGLVMSGVMWRKGRRCKGSVRGR